MFISLGLGIEKANTKIRRRAINTTLADILFFEQVTRMQKAKLIDINLQNVDDWFVLISSFVIQ